MATTIILDGVSFLDTDFAARGHLTSVTVNSVLYPRFQALFVAGMRDIVATRKTTSVTSNTIGTGSLTFTLAADLNLPVGSWAQVMDAASPTTNYVYGQVTSYTQSTKVVILNSTVAVGSGTLTSWVFQGGVGIRGATGSTGATYDISASTAITTTATGYTLAVSDGAGSAHNKQITIDNFLATLTLPIKVQQISETSSAVTASSTTVLDFTLGTVFDMAHGTNITTFTWSNPAAAGKATGFVLKRTKDNSGTTRTIAWPASVKWVAGTAPTLTQTANAVDMFVFITIDGGTTYDGYVAGTGMS